MDIAEFLDIPHTATNGRGFTGAGDFLLLKL
jgi:hypothetical protein